MLFVGDDWAEDHHDVEVVDDQGSVLARRRLPEGFDGIAALHALIANHLPEEWADLEPGQAQALVKVGIETDRGPWVAALVAAGYEVFAINPLSVARYREGTPPRAQSRMPPTLTCWPRSSDSTAITTGRSPATPRMPRRSS